MACEVGYWVCGAYNKIANDGLDRFMLGQRQMEIDEAARLPRPLHFLLVGLCTIGFLGLVVFLLPESYSTSPTHKDIQSEPRRHVLVLVVDSSDLVDAHGEHVHSVIRQYCETCEVRQLNVHGNMSTSRLLWALEQARGIILGVQETTSVIINLSWGTYTYHAVVHEAIRGLQQLGAVIIASAGNDNTSKPFYPAAFGEVLGICSSSRYRQTKAAYSNFGPWVSLCAPGLHYVSRPLQHGGVASGTSFASPMVSGVLGQMLLEVPCATTQQGLQALLRTADAFPDENHASAYGRLNASAAAHYLNTLYACNGQQSLGSRLLQGLRRVSSNALLLIGLLLYAVVSIFAFPFLFAYILECFRRRAEQQLNHMIQSAYAKPSAYRAQRLDMLKQHFRKARRLRYREATELYALLHAQYLFDEPCGWCGGRQLMMPGETLSVVDPQSEDDRLSVCARCGVKPDASPLSLER
jgi:hypothetical protein